ncbi:predicted protein [Naegleria gruberi]|uniref:Predicted protein n=1 Tax=Naegleria gruberi TaxID=5762 RepID=D2VGF8_NAEGR|nr:uncharacterized protein NAEGRDRAFT_67961 [Naegleria gruberi]EFC44057.1 predicted protein [Naegleria gruberi]|eukprot:XP_002676801.1 predicted protein [Naegleria gruberi strain NEG-M]
MQVFKRSFRMIEWDKQSAYIEITLEETQFESVRKMIFNTLLDKHAALFIEPTESLHSYHSNNIEICPGAMTFSAEKGFEIYMEEGGPIQLSPEMDFHNEILRAVGRYILIDERSGKYVFNVVNSEELNKYSCIGNIEPGTTSIPNTFDGFKVYFVKLNVKELIPYESIFHENSTISYYLSYIQDRHPMLYISPQIISSISERLKALINNDSFSSNALSMSLFTAEICSLFKKCTFAPESKMLEYIEKLKISQQSNDTKESRFIRSVTYKQKITYGLPQLMDDKRFFRKLHPDNFVKVKIIDVVPASIECCGKEYRPVGGSLSMLRSDYVYFFDTTAMPACSEVDELMQIFGTYDSNLNPFKLVSRHALNFTTTKETCTINKWKCVKDELAIDGSEMTDGIGKISQSIAQQISNQLGLVSVPTALQIRFLGFKGVLSVLPDEDLGDGMDVILRESMCKFNGKEELNKIELVSCTTARKPAYLNKQIILLLTTLGITKETFLSIFLDYFKDLSEKITSPKYFLKVLKENCMDTLPAIQSLNEMPDDEFLQYLARYLIYDEIKKVQTKAMIPIEKAVIAMSIVDEYKQLKENEVMVQLGDGNYIEDGTQVFICRNPCLHPSDIQTFTCRDNSLLRSKYRPSNAAIIFPTQGYTSIKICDFDGDRVFVCWDSRLIPDQVSNLSPLTHDNEPMESTTEHSEVLSKILENGKLLGKISDAWVAIVDSEGADSDRALELADLFVKAVDFPKNGKQISLPNWFKDIIYPDFMERGSISIKSNSIIGRIYEKCTSIKSGIPSEFKEPEFIIQDEKVNEWNRRFWQIIEYLKQVHYCTLFDLFVGNGIERKEFTHLIEQFREIAREENCKLAIQNLPIANIFSLTIPSRRITEFNKLDIYKNLAKSLNSFVEHMNLEQLEIMEKRLEQLKYKTNQEYRIHMFGSLPVLLHNSFSSDCDTFFDFKAEKGDENCPPVCSVLSSEFGSSATDWQKSVPMFRIFAKVTDLPFIESIDFTNSSRGLRKKHHLRLYLKQKPKLIVLLKVLIDLLKKICPHIKTYQLTWRIVTFCLEKNYLVQESPPTEQQAFDGEMEKDSVFMKQILGKCLNSEFQHETELIVLFLKRLIFKENMEFVDNLDGKITAVILTIEQVSHARDLLDSCILNLFLLHDFTKLSIEEMEESQVYVPSLLRKVLGNSMIETVLKSELEKSCNCKITNLFEMKNGNYIINATGEHGISSRLKRKLALWNANCKYFRANNHRLFLEGSTLAIYEGDSLDSPIEFKPYLGKCNPKHVLEPITKHQPKLKVYKEEVLPMYDFYQNLLTQLEKTLAIDLDPNHFTYSIKFGTYYLINIEKSIFSEIIPQDSKHYNSLMKKNHFHSIEEVKKYKEEKKPVETSNDFEKEWPLIDYLQPNKRGSSKSKSKVGCQNETPEIIKKKQEKKAPSDSFLTLVDSEAIALILKELAGCTKQEFTEYNVCEIENVERKNSVEYKVKLDENLKLKPDGILSRRTRVMATTFIGKTSDMRFYINHSRFLPEDHSISRLVNSLNRDQWIIRIDSPQQLTHHSELSLVNVVRKLEKQIYTYEHHNQMLEITILKVSLFTKKLSSLSQTLDLTSEHYELKIALPKTGILHSSTPCMALLSCGLYFWKIIQQSNKLTTADQ